MQFSNEEWNQLGIFERMGLNKEEFIKSKSEEYSQNHFEDVENNIEREDGDEKEEEERKMREEELKSQSKANNNKNESGEEDGMSQPDPNLDVVSDVSRMKIKQENIITQVGNHEDTLDEHENEILLMKEDI